MSEQKAELISGEPGSLSAEPAASPSSDAQNQRVGAAAQEPVQAAAHIASPDLVPEQAAAEPPEADAVKAEPAKAEAPKADAPRAPDKVMIMSAADRNWGKDDGAKPEAASEPNPGLFSKRRLAALAAPRDVTLVVGPEGGWTDRELALAQVKAGLGPRNMRADTAALVGLSVALAARE